MTVFRCVPEGEMYVSGLGTVKDAKIRDSRPRRGRSEQERSEATRRDSNTHKSTCGKALFGEARGYPRTLFVLNGHCSFLGAVSHQPAYR